jgi:hypothetical protein
MAIDNSRHRLLNGVTNAVRGSEVNLHTDSRIYADSWTAATSSFAAFRSRGRANGT